MLLLVVFTCLTSKFIKVHYKPFILSAYEQKCRIQLQIYRWEWNVYVFEEKQQTSYGTLKDSGFYSAPVKSVSEFVFIYS